MKIIIENTKFPYDIGCRLLKLKHENSPFKELEDIWNDIVPLTFKEIAQFENLEERRVGVMCLGLDRLVKEVEPKLISKKTVKKSTTWVNAKGVIETSKFNDTYELYEVNGDKFSEGLESYQKMQNSYFVKLKDTSTDRNYLIWVEPRSVYETNNKERYGFDINKINAIQCIAWTIQTNVPIGKIEKILRQGDCILIKPKGKYEPLTTARHLTENEYNTLLVAES
jgi:hypothetical protein